MRLKEWQEKFGVKRINFDAVKPSGLDYQCGEDNLVCPYCEAKIEYDGEEMDDIINGEKYQCPDCGKWFYVKGDITVNTCCMPMEESVLQSRRGIEDIYAHMDKYEEKGRDWPDNRYGIEEWSVYYAYAQPLFENEEIDNAGSDT